MMELETRLNARLDSLSGIMKGNHHSGDGGDGGESVKNIIIPSGNQLVANRAMSRTHSYSGSLNQRTSNGRPNLRAAVSLIEGHESTSDESEMGIYDYLELGTFIDAADDDPRTQEKRSRRREKRSNTKLSSSSTDTRMQSRSEESSLLEKTHSSEV